jgi:hypothetical protein
MIPHKPDGFVPGNPGMVTIYFPSRFNVSERLKTFYRSVAYPQDPEVAQA